jgi:hypothetical protein
MGVLLELRGRLAAGMQVAALGERDELSPRPARSSFALGRVVLICSCSMSEPAMLENIALRCSWVRFRRRYPRA